MSNKNRWITDAERILRSQALSSTELSFRLKANHRWFPSARKITLVLRGVKDRFEEINRVPTSLSLGNHTHEVSLWGLRGYKYDEKYPHSVQDGAYDD